MRPYLALSRLFVFTLITTAAAVLLPQNVTAQAEKLGIVSYQAPTGFSKTAKENVVAFARNDKATGFFCIITLYGATPGTGNPKSDFAREWKNLVVTPFKAEPNPKTESESAEGWTVTAGGSPVDAGGGKAVAFLSVYSRGDTAVSVLGMFNDESYLDTLTAFGSGLDFDQPIAVPPIPRAEEPSIAAPASSMHAAALVKEFENNEIRATQQYVGKRVRITGTVNTIEINSSGQIVLTFKSSITTYKNARCYFNKSQSARVAGLNAHVEATVEGTVKGLGDGFDNSKAYLVLENCTVP